MRSTPRARIVFAVLVFFMSMALAMHDAEARRLGAGKSLGRQSQNVTQKQAAPAQAAPAPQAPNAANTAPPPAAPKPAGNRWLGPLGGLVAGLGIAALLSHFGLGGALAGVLGPMLLIGLVVVAALLLFRLFRRAKGPEQSRLAYATAAPVRSAAEPVFALPNASAGAGSTLSLPNASGAAQATWVIPADFDVDNFLHIAKMYFVRLQTAWDAGNQTDLRDFTTPEMFAEFKLDLQGRGSADNQTDVVTLDANLLGVEELGEQTMASVRLSGMIREAADAPAEPFSEVWNLVKPRAAKASWVLAGIQQEH